MTTTAERDWLRLEQARKLLKDVQTGRCLDASGHVASVFVMADRAIHQLEQHLNLVAGGRDGA